MRKLPFVLVLIGGCTVGPDYERPPAPAPPAWGEAVDASAADLSRWWKLFRDPQLESLVDRAARGNLDLRVAQARVREARAQVGIARGAMLPEVGAGALYERSRVSENAITFPLRGLNRGYYQAGFDAAWELDLFGGNRRAIESAAADYEGAIEELRAARVTLLGEVARNYMALRGNQQVRATLRENVASARSTADLVRVRLRAGVATAFDLDRAEALRASTEALLPPVETSILESVHRLSVLLGQPPRDLDQELSIVWPIPSAPARVVVGLPSELLLRRPDVRAAERRLAASVARVGVATADLYPRISLTGAFGFESLHGDDLFKSASKAWAVGPSLRWPIFSAGRIRAQVAAADARAEEAGADFERAVLEALEEVENGLVAWLREGDRRRSLSEAVAANRRAAELADDLYRKGLASFLEVLEAQRSLYLTQTELARSETQLAVSLVALYKALGGGWEIAKE